MEETTITIPISSDQQDKQLQAFVMALIHSYGLTAVLDEMFEGLLTHYDESRVNYKVQGPILDSINVARTIAYQLLQEGKDDDTSN